MDIPRSADSSSSFKLKLWGCDARKKRQEVSDRWIYVNEVLEDKISIRLLQVQRLHAKPAWS